MLHGGAEPDLRSTVGTMRGRRGKGGEGVEGRGRGVMLHTNRSSLASHMITRTYV